MMPAAQNRITLPLLEGSVTVPIKLSDSAGTLLDLLPSAWRAADLATQDAIQEQVRAGKTISCKPHCGACCRQLVSISLPEAVRLADYVAEQPPERQQILRERFATIVQKLEENGLLDPKESPTGRALIPPAGVSAELAGDALAISYFQLQMPCPFLEDESCSIYEIRPSICREYHVTSPAEQCQKVYETPIDRVVPKFRTGVALMETAAQLAGVVRGHIPLSLSLEWASTTSNAIKQPRDTQTLAATLSEISLQQTERLQRGENVSQQTTDLNGSTSTSVDLNLGTRRLKFNVTVPNGPTSPTSMIPLGMALTDLAVEQGAVALAAGGESVSCQKGCGACCRQLVPISQWEAYHVAQVVRQLPEPRQTEIRDRFAKGLQTLADAGVLDDLRDLSPWPDGTRHRRAEDYYAAQVPCPFLENESCSIYSERPLTCREYLVSSPAENCSQPFTAPVSTVELPVPSPYRSFARAGDGQTIQEPVNWVPLILSLEWTAAHPEPKPKASGPHLLQAIFEHMTGSNRR